MNDGNIGFHIYDTKNKCQVYIHVSLASKMNGSNIQPHLMLFSSHHYLETLVA